MKFKITLEEFERVAEHFKVDKDGKHPSVKEIELEPVNTTATQAIYEDHLKREEFKKGYHYGYKEGFHDGRRSERPYRCTCGCNGTLCYNFHCGKVCP